jgi:hypothetical protein
MNIADWQLPIADFCMQFAICHLSTAKIFEF